MRECLAAKDITKDIRRKLPVIPKEIMRERGCSYCPYYGGNFEKQPRCIVKQCAWDTSDERFHPVLREMLPAFKKTMEKTQEKYEAAKTNYETLIRMFEAERRQEELEKDPCYKCNYARATPCIGICYKQLKI